MELFDLSGTTALVTGGSRGLGLEMAEGLGEAGARVVITARRRRWLEEATETLTQRGIDHLTLESDVSDPFHVDQAVSSALEKYGRIDILVNNAGVAWGAPALEMPLEKWRMVLEVNVTGTFLMCQRVGREMIGAGGGNIINTASIAGLLGGPPGVMDAVGYSASKGAIIALTRDLAAKWAGHGIRVNAIAPGYFPTRMTEGVLGAFKEQIEAAIPAGRIGREGELKGTVIFLASAASSYITGQVIVVDGGVSII